MEIFQDNPQPIAPPPAPRRRSRGPALLAGGTVAAALVIGGGAYAMADPTTPTPGAGATATGTAGAPGQAKGGMKAAMKGRGPLGQPLHGEMVTDQNGTYVTVRMQEGTVTATTSDSITVRSTDGYEQTYAVTSDTVIGGGRGMMGGRGHGHGRHGEMPGTPGATQGASGTAGATAQPTPPAEKSTKTLADVKVGDTVHVMATVKDGKATAVRLGDEAWRPADRPDRDQDGDHDGTTGTPAPTSTATTSPTGAQG